MSEERKIVTLEFEKGVCLQDLTGKLNTYRLAESVINIGHKPLFGGCYVILKLTTEQIRLLPRWLKEGSK